MSQLAAALSYLEAGLSIIPTKCEDKRPCILWKEFQTRCATKSEVERWYQAYPDAGVAIVCGAISGVVVVDGDPRNGSGLFELSPFLPLTPTVETGGGGRHYYFAAPPAMPTPKVSALIPGVDLQGEASYVVAPPTIHPSGQRYRWIPGLAFSEVSLAPLPAVIRHLVALNRQKASTLQQSRRPTSRDVPLESVITRLENVRRVGRGYLAQCPGHEDRVPSLSVGRANDGRLLMHCFAGCSFTRVLDALTEGASS